MWFFIDCEFIGTYDYCVLIHPFWQLLVLLITIIQKVVSYNNPRGKLLELMIVIRNNFWYSIILEGALKVCILLCSKAPIFVEQLYNMISDKY